MDQGPVSGGVLRWSWSIGPGGGSRCLVSCFQRLWGPHLVSASSTSGAGPVTAVGVTAAPEAGAEGVGLGSGEEAAFAAVAEGDAVGVMEETADLSTAGVRVIEVDRPDRKARRLEGKSDPIDAEAAARAVLAGRATGTPKSGDGPAEAVRALEIVCNGAVRACSSGCATTHPPGPTSHDAPPRARPALRSSAASSASSPARSTTPSPTRRRSPAATSFTQPVPR